MVKTIHLVNNQMEYPPRTVFIVFAIFKNNLQYPMRNKVWTKDEF